MIEVIQGDWITVLRSRPAKSVHCCVTSPPYWGQRDYGVAGQLGLEPTPEEYVAKIVEGFREVRRVLRDDGTLWINLGDSYASGGRGGGGAYMVERKEAAWQGRSSLNGWKSAPPGLKHKDLVGIPWRVAFALQADGWYLRSDIIWAKTNPMPESVTDRPTKAHEYIFLLSKSSHYYYDHEAIKEDAIYTPDDPANNWQRDTGKMICCQIPGQSKIQHRADRKRGEFGGKYANLEGKEAFRAIRHKRNKRTVWTIPTKPYPEAHFATYPPELIVPCILAGCPEGGTVLDPFAGSGTTGEVAGRLGRSALLIELNKGYIPLIDKRIAQWRDQVNLFEVIS